MRGAVHKCKVRLMTFLPARLRVKTLYRLAPRWREFICALRGMRNQKILSAREHLRLSVEWLLSAQQNSPEDGYSRRYSLITCWGKGYIECSGYMIPPML